MDTEAKPRNSGLADTRGVVFVITALALAGTLVGCLLFRTTWKAALPDGTSTTRSEGFGAWAVWVAVLAVATSVLIVLVEIKPDLLARTSQLFRLVAMVIIGGAGLFAAVHMRQVVDQPRAAGETLHLAVGLPIATLCCLVASGAIAWMLLLDYSERTNSTP